MIGRIRCVLSGIVDASELSSRSRLCTIEMKAITIEVAKTGPYKDAASFLNRIQNRDEQTCFVASTINSNIISWGDQIHQEQLRQASQALSDFGFDPETGMLRPGENLPESITYPLTPLR